MTESSSAVGGEVTQYQTEKGLQRAVVELALLNQWMVYHTDRSDRSEPGFPDLVLIRPPVVLFVENKTEKGQLRKGLWNKSGKRWLPGQDDWAEALKACPGVLYFLLRPSMWDEIEEVLNRPLMNVQVGHTHTARLSGGKG